MHETIAAQDGVASRQRVRRDIGEMIFTLDFSRGGAGLQALDQQRHDVDACITHTEIGLVDPACIAAGRIEQRSHAEFFEQPAIRHAARWLHPFRSPAPKWMLPRPTAQYPGYAASAPQDSSLQR